MVLCARRRIVFYRYPKGTTGAPAPTFENILSPARTKKDRFLIQKAMSIQKWRCCAVEAFWLKIGLPDRPVNSDNNSIGVLSPQRPGKHFILHYCKGALAQFLPFCRAGSVCNMAAQFGHALEYTTKRAEKDGVEAPRRVVVAIHRAI